jgi:hypothetical protein
VLKSLRHGHTYRLTGRQLNGLSQANAYGDDAQMATNYPLVRLKRVGSNKVFFLPHVRPLDDGGGHGEEKASHPFPRATHDSGGPLRIGSYRKRHPLATRESPRKTVSLLRQEKHIPRYARNDTSLCTIVQGMLRLLRR